MKIIGPENIQEIHPASQPSSKSIDRPEEFGKMLREALNQSATNGTQNVSSLSEPLSVQNFIPPATHTTALGDRAARAVDLLETYSEALSDPGKTLREIEPSLSAFINETESIYQEYIESDNQNAQLKEIMETLLRTARSEGIRFQRGDYLES